MAKILIIDDDPDIVEAMKVVLKTKDHQVASAASGAEGLKLARLDQPDLIILDVMMEKMDTGFSVARELKKDKNYQNIPILMLTAIKESTGLDFQKEAGDEDWLPVDSYLDKPLKPAELIDKVDSLLSSR
ncbi:MAG: response regulator [Elusimicrobia bacterium]|nr:response regulator [Elusimicrobiota bacterium]